MKTKYKFGEILLYVREEYKECEQLLNELNKCISVTKNKDFHFEGDIWEKESKIRLIVEKKYSEILKKIQWLRYNTYSDYFYTAYFNVIRNEDNEYTLEKDSMLTPLDDNKKFTPSVDILYQEKFDSLIDSILSLDVMKLQRKSLRINHDLIRLDFGRVFVSSKLGYESFLHWVGNTDVVSYSVKKDCCPYLLEEILYLEIPAEYIPSEWVQIFEKHENKFGNDIFFDVDINASKRKGYLQIDTSNNEEIKLLVNKNHN